MNSQFEYSYIVVLETASNQSTIFQTNRLRENIGASQLIYQVGTDFVAEAVKEIGGARAEIVVGASGRAVVLARCECTAKALVRRVTRRTLNECPGVIARGAYAPIIGQNAKGLDSAIAAAQLELRRLPGRLPPSQARFQRLPFVRNCASSSYPAAAINRHALNDPATSETILARRTPGILRAARKRIGEAMEDFELFKTLEQFADAAEKREIGDWIAIVHADGNGLGQVFLSFTKHLCGERDPEKVSAREYVDTLGEFSSAIDRWSAQAVSKAVRETWSGALQAVRDDKQRDGKKPYVPVAPVVLGGDDLTVICEGARAVEFAARYVEEFEDASRADLQGEIGERLPGLKEKGHIAAAAGIAIVKPHFPFHRAYELSEQLTRSAKTAKEKFGEVPCSALDFQVVFDSSGGQLEPIRGRMQGAGGEGLIMRPYVLTPLTYLSGAPKNAQEWAERRLYRRDDQGPSLKGAIDALVRRPEEDASDDGHCLPRSQAHVLHDALYMGAAIADGRLDQIRDRYGEFPWSTLTVKDNEGLTLFRPDGAKQGAYLLDAMELADLMGA